MGFVPGYISSTTKMAKAVVRFSDFLVCYILRLDSSFFCFRRISSFDIYGWIRVKNLNSSTLKHPAHNILQGNFRLPPI